MPWLGAHMSIAGGYHNAVLQAARYQCQAVQLFTALPGRWPVVAAPSSGTNNRRARDPTWVGKAVSDDEARQFRACLRKARIRYAIAHNSYLINIASADAGLYRRSIEALVLELQRAEQLGLHYLVMHPGAPVDSTEQAGIARVARALDEVHARCSRFRTQILLETTAGQGSCLGCRFEQLGRILSLVSDPVHLGVCLDTCHVFAAGYALAPRKEYEQTMKSFARAVGLEKLKAFHLNDSLKPLGSSVDRHAHIGQGQLGLEPFRLLLNDPRFRTRPMVIETPKEDDKGRDMDASNLSALRELLVDRKTRR